MMVGLVRPEYTLYIDETGTHGISPKALRFDRHFCLFGTIAKRPDYVEKLVPELGTIKNEIFGPGSDSSVVLHQREIDARTGVFAVLSDPSLRHKYNTLMVSLLKRIECRYIAVAMDKKAHFEQHGSRAWHVYWYTAKLMLERFCFFLEERHAVGRVRAESRSDAENAVLNSHFQRYCQNGTEFVSPETFATHIIGPSIRFHTKQENVVGLQISDVLANMALEEMLVDRGVKKRIGNHGRMHYLDAIRDKWHQRSNGEVVGCGKVFLPRNTKAAVVDCGPA